MTEFSQAEMRNVEQACHALAVEYAEIIDSQDYARLVEVFAEDALFLRPMAPKEPIRGVDKIVEMFQSRPRGRLTQHLISNFRVRMETMDTAVGSCRVLFFSSDESAPETPEGRKAASKQSIGVYHDRYVRTKNGWRIAERAGAMIFYT
jgi:ketosteroid isomerase-like protein